MSKPDRTSCAAGGLSKKVTRNLEAFTFVKKETGIQRIPRENGSTEIRFPADWHAKNRHPETKLSRPPVHKFPWSVKS